MKKSERSSTTLTFHQVHSQWIREKAGEPDGIPPEVFMFADIDDIIV